MVFLIVISDLYFGTQSEGTAVGTDHLVQDLKKSSLPCPVIADDGHMFSPLDLKTDVPEKNLAVELFRKPLYRKHVVPAGISGFKSKMHLLDSLCRFLNRIDLLQHFFPALCPAYGLLTVKGAKLLDDSLLMPDLSLLIQIFF